jgi:hypothetical protein
MDFDLYSLESGTTISGIVTDSSTDQPLGGVRVDAVVGGTAAATTYTCAEGWYELDLSGVVSKTTTVTLRFEAEDYEIEERQVVFEPGELRQEDVALVIKPNIAVGSISGTVTDAANGAGVPGAQVAATASGGITRAGFCDSGGTYVILGVPVGAHSLRASVEGYDTQRASVYVTDAVSAEHHFQLTPRGPGGEGEGEGEGPPSKSPPTCYGGGDHLHGSSMNGAAGDLLVMGLALLALLVARGNWLQRGGTRCRAS